MKNKYLVLLRSASYKWQLLIMICIAFGGVIFCSCAANANDIKDRHTVRGNFSNTLKFDTDKNPAAMTIFGGHVKVSPDGNGDPQETKSSDGSLRLTSSSFGHPVSRDVPYPSFQDDARMYSLKRLYYDWADNRKCFEKKFAAFRYKALLYKIDGSDDGKHVRAKFEEMPDLWDEKERARARNAADIVKDALAYNPFNSELRNILLDIYYDMAAAEMVLANQKIVKVELIKLGPRDSQEFVISKEIGALNEILFEPAEEGDPLLYDSALNNYLGLLTDTMGVNMSLVDPAASDEPFGYYLFKTEVPKRSLLSTSYADPSGTLKPLIDDDGNGEPDPLFQGFKDLVLLFRIERDATRAAAELAKLYGLRGNPDDFFKANEVIGHFVEKAHTEGSILNGIFPDTELLEADSKSGLSAAKAGWAQALTSLSGTKSFLEGGANPLGMDKDFLGLVQSPEEGQDSFDYFKDELISILDGPLGPLKAAVDAYEDAFDQYQDTKRFLSQFKEAIKVNRDRYEGRLINITGATVINDACYNNPVGKDENGNACASEIMDLMHDIEYARKRIDQNTEESANLEREINIELNRRGQLKGVNNQMAQTYVKYGDKQAQLSEVIGGINAAQAMSHAVTAAATVPVGDPFEWLTVAGAVVAHLTNGAVQAVSEATKGVLEGDKEQLAALENATIQYLNGEEDDINSQAIVSTLLLKKSTLRIESEQEAILFKQAMGRLSALWAEFAYLESLWKEDNQALSERYFADPSHRLFLDQYVIDSNFAFDIAQEWVFMMARALEYKWNKPFLTKPSSAGGRQYTKDDVFTLRNASELEGMVSAMATYDGGAGIGERKNQDIVEFSLREDFLGYKKKNKDGSDATYPDPISGDPVDAITAFRSYMKKNLKDKPKASGIMAKFSKLVHLEFGTLTTNLGATFFSPDNWNEKIVWTSLKIKAPAQNNGQLKQLKVYLEQSGTGYLRNRQAGKPDKGRPDHLIGEWTTLPVRHFYRVEDPDQLWKWNELNQIGFGITAQISESDDEPPERYQKRHFEEFTPAVSKWTMEIPTKQNVNGKIVTVLDLDEVTDIEFRFQNRAILRPAQGSSDPEIEQDGNDIIREEKDEVTIDKVRDQKI